jgi:hypothetical protein
VVEPAQERRALGAVLGDDVVSPPRLFVELSVDRLEVAPALLAMRAISARMPREIRSMPRSNRSVISRMKVRRSSLSLIALAS